MSAIPLPSPSSALIVVTPSERAALDATLAAFQAAVAHSVAAGRDASTTGLAVLQRLCYRDLRDLYGLPANLAVRAVAAAARALRDDSETIPEAIEYDARVYRLAAFAQSLCLTTVQGQLRNLPLLADDGVRALLATSPPARLLVAPDAGDHYAIYW